MSQMHASPSSYDRLLQAARALFARQGFVHTSTAQVARNAGTSESQLVKHFGGKEGLLEALFDDVWRDVNRQIAEITAAHSDPVTQLKTIIVFMLARIAANQEISRLMLFEGRRIGSRGPSLSAGFVQFVGRLDAILKQAKRSGRFRLQLAPAAIRSLVMGACEGLLRDRLLAEDSGYSAAFSRKDALRAVDALMDTFFC